MSHNNPHSDLNKAMRQEAREEAQAHAEATRKEAFIESLEEQSEEELVDMHEGKEQRLSDIRKELRKLQNRMDLLEEEADQREWEQRMIQEELEIRREQG